jgi:hypothetical protein
MLVLGPLSVPLTLGPRRLLLLLLLQLLLLQPPLPLLLHGVKTMLTFGQQSKPALSEVILGCF